MTRVRGTAHVHFEIESVRDLTDREIRDAVVQLIGFSAVGFGDIRARTTPIEPEDVDVQRGVDG